MALRGHSAPLRATRWPLSGPLRGHQRAPQWPSEVLSGLSEVIRGTQRHSEVIRDHSEPLRATQWHPAGTQRHSEGPLGTRSSPPLALRIARPSTLSLTSAPPTSTLTHLLSLLLCFTHSKGGCPFTWPLMAAHRWRWCRRSSWRTRRPPWRRTRYAAPPPLPCGSEALSGHQRSSYVIKGNQWSSFAIRGHSAPLRATQWPLNGPLRGHQWAPQRPSAGPSVAIRGTQWLIRGDQRYSEALRGHQRPLRATQGHSVASSGHSEALRGPPRHAVFTAPRPA